MTPLTGFTKPEDIINRALQRIGAKRIVLLTEGSRNANEAAVCYDKLRRAEYGMNNWRFAIAECALRAIDGFNQSKFVTFAAWAVGTTYAVNDVVTGSDGQTYFSLKPTNLANDPTQTSGFWALYFGPLTAQEYVTAWGSGFTYAIGDHAVGSDNNVYVSLIANNINNIPTSTVGTDWQIATTQNAADTTQATGTSFYTGELVFIGATVYLSLQSANTDVPPTSKWLTLTGVPSLTVPQFAYPLGSGPLSQSNSRNVYRLPANYLRLCPRDPKAGMYSIMGAPSNMAATDWRFEGDYIVSQDAGPIILRFIHDMSDVTHMHPLFCEGLGARVAMELCEILTQSATKLQAIEGEYKTFMQNARIQDGIEQGPVEYELDDFLLVRY